MKLIPPVLPTILPVVRRIPHPHTMHEALLHMAVVVFGLDALAYVWPTFGHWWQSKFHFMVALAVLVDALANHGDVFNRHIELQVIKSLREVEERHEAELAKMAAAKRPARKRSTT